MCSQDRRIEAFERLERLRNQLAEQVDAEGLEALIEEALQEVRGKRDS